MYSTYAIYNQGRDRIYVGHSGNLQDRLERHNRVLPNKNKSFTAKNSGNWELVHEEKFETRQEAMVREKQLKSAQGRKFIRSLIDKEK